MKQINRPRCQSRGHCPVHMKSHRGTKREERVSLGVSLTGSWLYPEWYESSYSAPLWSWRGPPPSLDLSLPCWWGTDLSPHAPLLLQSTSLRRSQLTYGPGQRREANIRHACNTLTLEDSSNLRSAQTALNAQLKKQNKINLILIQKTPSVLRLSISSFSSNVNKRFHTGD